MGLELQYQALPQGCGLAELARDLAESGSEWAGFVTFLPTYMAWDVEAPGQILKPGSEAEKRAPHLRDSPVWKWCCEAAARFPGIEKRNLYVGKRVSRLRFIVSPAWRKYCRWPKPHGLDPRAWDEPPAEFEAALAQAFFEAPAISPMLKGAQVGGSIGIIEPSVATDIGVHAESLEESKVAGFIDELVARGDLPSRDVDTQFKLFRDFRSFFLAAGNAGDSVLVVHD